MPEPVTYQDAQQLVKYCYCSDCWEHLNIYTARDADGAIVKGDDGRAMVEVRCATEACAHHGYVSKKTVERRLADSLLESRQVRSALRDAVPWIRPSSQASEMLKELGF